MSIYENILYGKENATRTEVEEAARQANAHDFIMQLPKVCLIDVHPFILIYVRYICVNCLEI